MKFLGGILLLAGYMLVYSATAKGGLFASDPWTSLYADAYETFGDFIGSQVISVGNTVGGAISNVGNQVAANAGSQGTPGGTGHTRTTRTTLPPSQTGTGSGNPLGGGL